MPCRRASSSAKWNTSTRSCRRLCALASRIPHLVHPACPASRITECIAYAVTESLTTGKATVTRFTERILKLYGNTLLQIQYYVLIYAISFLTLNTKVLTPLVLSPSPRLHLGVKPRAEDG